MGEMKTGKWTCFCPIGYSLCEDFSPVYDHNYIVGIDSDNQPRAIRLSKTHKISVLENKIEITEELCELINDHLYKIYDEEYNECLD